MAAFERLLRGSSTQRDNAEDDRDRHRDVGDVGDVGPQPGKGPLDAAELDALDASSGRPLESGLRAELEQALGYDLGDVRVHTDAHAENIAARVQARAFTVGQAVYFGSGRFDPTSSGGRILVAHEVAHTIQQRGATRSGPVEIGPSGSGHEAEAERFAETFAAGSHARGAQIGAQIGAQTDARTGTARPAASRAAPPVQRGVVARAVVQRDLDPSPQGGAPTSVGARDVPLEELVAGARRHLNEVRPRGPQAVATEIRSMQARAQGSGVQVVARLIAELTPEERAALTAPATPPATGTPTRPTPPSSTATPSATPTGATPAPSPTGAAPTGATGATPASTGPALAPPTVAGGVDGGVPAPSGGPAPTGTPSPDGGTPTVPTPSGGPAPTGTPGPDGGTPAVPGPSGSPDGGTPAPTPGPTPTPGPSGVAPTTPAPAPAPAPAADPAGRTLIDQELSFHENWQAMRGGTGSRLAHMFASGEMLRDLGQGGLGVASQTGMGLAINAAAARIPIDSVTGGVLAMGLGNIIGGTLSGYALYSQFGTQQARTQAWNTFSSGFSTQGKTWALAIADFVTSIKMIIDLVANICNVLSGLAYVFAVIAALGGLLSIVCPPLAVLVPYIPAAINFGRACGGIASICMAVSNGLSIIPPIFRAIHVAISNDDPIRLVNQERQYHSEIQGAIANYGSAALDRDISTTPRGRALTNRLNGRASTAPMPTAADRSFNPLRQSLRQFRQGVTDGAAHVRESGIGRRTWTILKNIPRMARGGEMPAGAPPTAAQRATSEQQTARERLQNERSRASIDQQVSEGSVRTQEQRAARLQVEHTQQEAAATSQEQAASRTRAELDVAARSASEATAASTREQTALAAERTALANEQAALSREQATTAGERQTLAEREAGLQQQREALAQRERTLEQRRTQEAEAQARRDAAAERATRRGSRRQRRERGATARSTEERLADAQAQTRDAEVAATQAREAQTQAEQARTQQELATSEAQARATEAQGRATAAEARVAEAQRTADGAAATARTAEAEARRVGQSSDNATAATARARATQAAADLRAAQTDAEAARQAAARSRQAEIDARRAIRDGNKPVDDFRRADVERARDSGQQGEVGNMAGPLVQAGVNRGIDAGTRAVTGATPDASADDVTAARAAQTAQPDQAPVVRASDQHGHVILPGPPPPGSTAWFDTTDARLTTLQTEIGTQQEITATATETRDQARQRAAQIDGVRSTVVARDASQETRSTAGQTLVTSQNAQVTAQSATGNEGTQSAMSRAAETLAPIVGTAHTVNQCVQGVPNNQFFDPRGTQQSTQQFVTNLDQLSAGRDGASQNTSRATGAIDQRRTQANAASTVRGESRGDASTLVNQMTADAGVARQVTGEATGQVSQSQTHQQQLQAEAVALRQERQQKWSAMMAWATNHAALREQVSDEHPSEEVHDAPVGDFPTRPADPAAPQMA